MYRIHILFLLFFIISYSSTCQTIIKNGVVIGKEIQKQEIPSEVTTVFGNPIRCVSKLNNGDYIYYRRNDIGGFITIRQYYYLNKSPYLDTIYENNKLAQLIISSSHAIAGTGMLISGEKLFDLQDYEVTFLAVVIWVPSHISALGINRTIIQRKIFNYING